MRVTTSTSRKISISTIGESSQVSVYILTQDLEGPVTGEHSRYSRQTHHLSRTGQEVDKRFTRDDRCGFLFFHYYEYELTAYLFSDT